MKTPEEFIKEYYQLTQSKIETVRIKSLIRCLEREKEYHESEVKKLNKPDVIKSVCECPIYDTYRLEGNVRCRKCGRKRDKQIVL